MKVKTSLTLNRQEFHHQFSSINVISIIRIYILYIVYPVLQVSRSAFYDLRPKDDVVYSLNACETAYCICEGAN